jgi:hypothetical protein
MKFVAAWAVIPALEADLGDREALVPGPRPNLHQSRRCCLVAIFAI